jgi:nitrogen regulatory protein P-II 2
MKKLEVLIAPSQLDRVRSHLIGVGIWELSVSDVVQSHKTGNSVPHWGADEADYCELLKLELVTEDESVGSVVSAIRAATDHARLNAARVIILPVEQSMRIRCGERGPIALSARRGRSAAA